MEPFNKTLSNLSRHLKGFLPLIFLFCIPTYCISQISISSGDLLGLIGKSQQLIADGRDSLPVSVGMPGANQEWDFRNVVIEDTILQLESFLEPSATAFGASFPTANWSQVVTSPSFPGASITSYFKIEADGVVELGQASSIVDPIDTTVIASFNDTVINLPINYQDTWLRLGSPDTFEIVPGFISVTQDSAINTVDAWGTVRLPFGDVSALRIRELEFTKSTTVIGGIVSDVEVDTFLTYLWLSKDNYIVASASALPGETDPEFSVGSSFGILIDDGGNTTNRSDLLETEITALKVYPNPGKEAFSFSFELEKGAYVSLEILDPLGREIATVHEGMLGQGTHSYMWDGKSADHSFLQTGLYLYRIEVNGSSQVGKLILK